MSFNKDDATGRWASIFSELGIEVGAGEHRPCPWCGGKDRFRFDNKNGDGTWICNQCGAGDGWVLVERMKGVDFAGALKIVSGIIGDCNEDENEEKSCNIKGMIQKIWKESAELVGDSPVRKYLRNRGLMYFPKVLKYNPACFNAETGGPLPAMIAPVQNPDNKCVALHRTYLTPDGAKAAVEKVKMLTPVTEKICGGAIRLFPYDDTLGVAEGIETAIACMQLLGVPTWAAISSSIMEKFEPPESARKIIIFGDNDPNYTGQKTAYILANRLYAKDFIVDVQFPDFTGDFNDVLLKQTPDRKESAMDT